jgi:hypothetical protein
VGRMGPVVLIRGDGSMLRTEVVVVVVFVLVLVVEKVTMGRGGTGRVEVRYHACSSHIMVQNQLELTRGSP